MTNTTTTIKAHLKSTERGRRLAQSECTKEFDEYRYFPSIEAALQESTDLVAVIPVEAITYCARTNAYISHEVLT
jgi:hypothetical protein